MKVSSPAVRLDPSDLAIVSYHLENRMRNEVLPRFQAAAVNWVKPLGVAPLFAGPHTVETPTSEWAIVRAEEDPTFISGDLLRYMPRDNRRQLEMVLEVCNPPAVYVAHEGRQGFAERIRREGRIPMELVVPAQAELYRPVTNALLERRRDLGGRKNVLSPAVGKVLMYSLLGAGLLVLSPLWLLGAIAQDPVILAAFTLIGTGDLYQPAYFVELTRFDWAVRR